MTSRPPERPSSGVWEFFKFVSEDDPVVKCTQNDVAIRGHRVSRGDREKPKKTWGLKVLWQHLEVWRKE